MSKEKIAVAMSGGVDSSVAAAFLSQEGYDVFGVTMITHEAFRPNAAEKICQRIGISHHVLDLKAAFKREVIDYFCQEYLKARTPNPCVVCNWKIKFGKLLDWVLSQGAIRLATGHYTRLEWDKTKKRYLLRKAEDKDQSYMLWALDQEQLSKIMFPLGALSKSEVYRLAGELGFLEIVRAESQEICFIPDHDYGRFLSEQKSVKVSSGPIVNLEGEKLGQHKGLSFYTVGQRKGLGITSPHPLYVVELRLRDNTLVVGKEEALYKKHLLAGEANFVAFERLRGRVEVEVKVRYQVDEASAFISLAKEGQVQVDFLSPQRAIAPGQSVVFYRGDLLLGGGVIDSTW